MTKQISLSDLARRERQIMDVLYERGEATVAEVLDGLTDPPSYSAVRAMLGKLEAKNYVRHVERGPRYVYQPIMPHEEASETALERIIRTFFDDSPVKAMAALLDLRSTAIDDEEVAQLTELIENARRRGL